MRYHNCDGFLQRVVGGQAQEVIVSDTIKLCNYVQQVPKLARPYIGWRQFGAVIVVLGILNFRKLVGVKYKLYMSVIEIQVFLFPGHLLQGTISIYG